MIKLKKGEMTETPVKTQFGWHIIKLEDTREAQFPPLDDVKGADPAAPAQQKPRAFRDEIRAKAKTDYVSNRATPRGSRCPAGRIDLQPLGRTVADRRPASIRSWRSQRAAMRAVVRHQHQRRAGLAVQREHQLDDRLAGREVEAAGRFVGEQHRRPHDEGARQRDALLFAARQHLRVVAQPFAQADAAAASRRPARARRAGPAVRAAASRSRARSGWRAAGSSGTRNPTLRGAHRGARVLVEREQIDAGQPHRAVVGVSSPAMIDSSVLLPDPEAPTIATDSRAAG